MRFSLKFTNRQVLYVQILALVSILMLMHCFSFARKQQKIPTADIVDTNHIALIYANTQYNELSASIDSLQELLNATPFDYKIFKKTNNDSVSPLSDTQFQIFSHLANLRKKRKETEDSIDSIKLVIHNKETISTEKPINQVK